MVIKKFYFSPSSLNQKCNVFFFSRLQEMCHYYMGEAGEFDIYNAFSKGKENLTKFLCYGKGIYSHCTPLKPSVKTEL